MSFNYRFSVIPAGAIIDERLTPRALQVLCLLGRHTNNQGWCTRSQVKMARELRCGRSTVQDAIELLVDTGWVEKRANGRGSRAPESGEQPFAAYSYRVRLDRDDLPAALTGEDEAPAEEVGGAGTPAGGAGTPAGGAGSGPAPLEGYSQGISSEPERDARAREEAHEKFAKWLAAFKLQWPTAAADDQSRIANAARGLTEAERKDAMAKIPEFLDHLRKVKRSNIPAGWKYLEEKRWTLLGRPDAQAAQQRPMVPEASEQGLIWRAIMDIAGRQRDGFPHFWLSGPPMARMVTVPCELPAVLSALNTDRTVWIEVREAARDGRFAAWMRWLQTHIPPNFIRSAGADGRVLRVPFPWPPRKDGTIGQGADPPEEPTAA
jgi:hypothetical protein